MIARAIRWLYPDLPETELKKFVILTLLFFLIIGSYWLVGLLKDTLFFKLAFPTTLDWPEGYGRLMQPTAKFWSPFVVMLLVLIYSKLVDLVRRYQLFYILGTFFIILFSVIGAILAVRSWYGDAFIGKTLLAATGWICYFASDSFGSLMVVLFWSFTISITSTEHAKQGFPLIIAGAQLGSISGSALTFAAQRLGGIWPLFFFGSAMIALVMMVVAYFMRIMPATLFIHQKQPADEGLRGFITGIQLLCTRPYLIGIFIISTFHEIAAVVVDYQMRAHVDTYPYFAGELGFAYFQTIFGIAVNSCTFVIALLGSRNLLKTFGTRICLLIIPVSYACMLIALFLYIYVGHPSTTSILWFTFAMMILMKGLSYALNNPTRDILYIPTSKDVQFKTKGFIDTFGARMTLMSGARISNFFKQNMQQLMTYGTLLSLGTIGIWLIAAILVGKKNQQLIKEQHIIE